MSILKAIEEYKTIYQYGGFYHKYKWDEIDKNLDELRSKVANILKLSSLEEVNEYTILYKNDYGLQTIFRNIITKGILNLTVEEIALVEYLLPTPLR